VLCDGIVIVHSRRSNHIVFTISHETADANVMSKFLTLHSASVVIDHLSCTSVCVDVAVVVVISCVAEGKGFNFKDCIG
jgi:hypothetical protein